MPRRRIEHEQRLHRSLGILPRNHAADLFQFLHQVRLVVQAARGVHDQHIGKAALGSLHAIEHHGGGIRAFGLLHNRHACALRPYGELICRSRAERIARADDHAAPDRAQARGQLADGGGFAHAVHSDHQQYHGRGQLHRLAAHEFHQNVLEHLARLLRVGDFLRLAALAQAADGIFGGFHTHIRHDQHVGQILIELIGQILVQFHQFIHASAHVFPRARKALANPVKQAQTYRLPFCLSSMPSFP